ncbi:MAG: tetratricopeptide repeat protein, partial [Cyclobacteriaceae bacterium]|nr:tetratricopeptide repeat protein [Cyclobacteriaceae bacterium]
MMAKSKKKGKQSKGEELLENPEVLAEQISKTEEFIEKNKKLVFSIGGALSIIVAAYFLYNYWITNQNEAAQSEMFQAVYYFEADSLDNALNGDGNNYGFLDIIEEYAMTDAANLANYYTGAIYLKKGEYISAVDYLDKFSSNDLLIQARAYALIGDANMEMGNFEEAVSYYNKAADYNPNEYTSPMYLIKAAIAYEILEDYKSAFDCYNTIVEKYV